MIYLRSRSIVGAGVFDDALYEIDVLGRKFSGKEGGTTYEFVVVGGLPSVGLSLIHI